MTQPTLPFDPSDRAIDQPRQPKGKFEPIPVVKIGTTERLRPIDSMVVNALTNSIRERGLIHPIGVRVGDPQKGEPLYVLLHGAHRYQAWIDLRTAAIDMEDPDQRVLWSHIPASVFPAEITADDAKLIEVEENLRRKELTTEERAAQTTIYLGLVKRRGDVLTANEVRRAAHQGGVTGSVPVTPPSPTITQVVSKDLGLDDSKTVRNRVASATRLAKEAGATVPAKVTPESTDAGTLIDIGMAAMDVASSPTRKRDKANARKHGRTRTKRVGVEPAFEPTSDHPVEDVKRAWFAFTEAQKREIWDWLTNQPGWEQDLAPEAASAI
jgi:hypothetical protein